MILRRSISVYFPFQFFVEFSKQVVDAWFSNIIPKGLLLKLLSSNNHNIIEIDVWNNISNYPGVNGYFLVSYIQNEVEKIRGIKIRSVCNNINGTITIAC